MILLSILIPSLTECYADNILLEFYNYYTEFSNMIESDVFPQIFEVDIISSQLQFYYAKYIYMFNI